MSGMVTRSTAYEHPWHLTKTPAPELVDHGGPSCGYDAIL